MAAATALTLTGPAAGAVNAVSTNFTVALSPVGGTVTGTVTVTPASALGFTITPPTVGLTTGAPSATFTVTPTGQGTDTISVTNTGGLTNPGSLSYLASPAPGAEIQITGNVANPSIGTHINVVPNTYQPILATITESPTQWSAANLITKAAAGSSTAILTKAGLIVDPGTLQADGTYTVKVLFACLAADTVLMTPGTTYSFSVQGTLATSGYAVPAIEAGVWNSVSGGPTG